MSESKQPSPYSDIDTGGAIGTRVPGSLLPHCVPGQIRGDELYWDKGFYFSRMKEGWIHIRVQLGTGHADAMIQPDAWAAILDHLGTPDQAIAPICQASGCMEFNR